MAPAGIGEMKTITTESSEPQNSEAQERALHLACACARVADDYRGTDTVVLNLTSVTRIADYFVITTATSRRQMHAIADESSRMMRKTGSQRIGTEGYDGDTWVLQDYGDVVIHVFNPETRTLYDLEHLWADAEKIDWQSVPLDDAE